MKQYISKAEAADMFHVTKATIGSVIQEIQRDHIGNGRRYDGYAFTGQGKTLLIRYAVLVDYMRYREWLSDPDTINIVPAFNARKVEHDLGVMEREVETGIDPDLIADAVVKKLVERMRANT